jgi:ABC-2 type transport system permease protein
MRDFLWSKFWVGLVPVLLLTEGLIIAANELLGIDPLLKVVAGATILGLSFALVGLAMGLGARYPRFDADNATAVAGSYGGVVFMVLAVLIILVVVGLVGWPSSVYLWYGTRNLPVPPSQQVAMAFCFAAAALVNGVTWRLGMRTGVRALEDMGGERRGGNRRQPTRES